MKNCIAVVDDDRSIRETLESILADENYTVFTAGSIGEFRAKAGESVPPVVILDLSFGENQPSGEELLTELSGSHPNTQVIIISGESDMRRTAACLRDGAADFIEKPVSLPRLLTAVKNAFAAYKIREKLLADSAILGNSAAVRQVMSRIRKLARLKESVLITGENGTGKELAARNLHLFSPRSSELLVPLNCTALNPNLIESELFGHEAGSYSGAKSSGEGYFRRADRGTLFIDEIGDFDLQLQSKILRVIQEKTVTPVGSREEIPVDIRPIFATHQNLPKMISEGRFREDLYFRISTFTIELPPLRDRIEDVPILAEHFLDQFTKENDLPELSFHPQAVEKLMSWSYPGNIRELSKIIKNCAFFAGAGVILPEDISFSGHTRTNSIFEQTAKMNLTDSKKVLERELIMHRLKQCGGSLDLCAESLGLIKNNLYRKLREHEIEF